MSSTSPLSVQFPAALKQPVQVGSKLLASGAVGPGQRAHDHSGAGFEGVDASAHERPHAALNPIAAHRFSHLSFRHHNADAR